MSLTETIKKVRARIREDEGEPLWTGPDGEGPNGGVTQGLLSRFLGCRKRFYVWAIKGWRVQERFSPQLEFGNLWHAAEEAHAAGEDIFHAIDSYANILTRRYPFDRENVLHWYEMAYTLFPRYIEHWQKHPDVLARKPLLQEHIFDVRYSLPSGRIVRLRGKWDSVDLVRKGKDARIWLQENKTKSSIDAQKIERQLRNDLQTMLYLIALQECQEELETAGHLGKEIGKPIAGVRYNVVRRSAHKSTESMLKKFEEDKRNGRIEEWFARWNVLITVKDLRRFRKETLDPLLEQLCLWWDFTAGGPSKYDSKIASDMLARSINYRVPYGIYNPIAEGGFGDLDEYLDTGCKVALHKAETMFPELAQEEGHECLALNDRKI